MDAISAKSTARKSDHPYRRQPPHAFWKRVVQDVYPLDIGEWYKRKYSLAGKRIASAGSCFAQHIGHALRRNGFNYVDVEPAPGFLAVADQIDYGYGLYSGRYGNIYTSRQLLQLALRATGQFEPSEQAWNKGEGFVDPFRPEIEPEPLSSPDAVEEYRQVHLKAIASLFKQTDVFIFTFGLTETWASKADGAAFPNCPGVAGGTFDAERYEQMRGSRSPLRMPDVVFISDLIDTLAASYNIDPARIYANGLSNGGGMSFVLSCTLSNRIAAVGMVSAGLDPGWEWCPDHRPVPVIAFHGTADPICPYDGGPSKLAGGTFPSVPGFMANWSRRNGCGPNPIESAVAPDVTRLQFTDCADNANVMLYTVKGEGHQWPGGKRVRVEWMVGPYSRSIDATRQMWAFFREHQLARRSSALLLKEKEIPQ